MKRLVLGGAVLFGCFSGMVSACGSRSSDDVFLPGLTAGDSGLAGGLTAGNAGAIIGSGGAATAGSPSGGFGALSGFGGSSGAIEIGGGGGAIPHGGTGAGGAAGSAGAAATGGVIGVAGSPAGGSGAVSGGGGSGIAGGGSGGTSGTAGAGGGNSAFCPIATPNSNSVCSDVSLQCNYTGRSCSCRQFGNTLRWRCAGSGNACPGTEPVATSACAGTLQCPYPDGDQCNCGASAKWNCFTAGCPASKPTPSASCGSVFGQCTYGAGPGSACVCVAGVWFCN